MPSIHAIPNWPSSTRLPWVFLVSGWLSTFSVFARHWFMYTYDTDAGPMLFNPVGMAASLAMLCGLVALCWSEQRWPRALLEANIAGMAWGIPVLIDNANHGYPTWFLVFSFFLGLALFSAVRLIALAVVRFFVRKLVLSTAPFCRRCGRDLTGQVSSTCPECATACLDAGAALETAEATANAESDGQYRRPGLLLVAVCALGLLMMWTVFHDFRSGYDLSRIGRDLILIAILAGLLATIYVRQKKA